ncbi:hypothetical protein VPH35_119990 [Triticum aestivum]
MGGVSWAVADWIMSPVISKLLDKTLSYCKPDKPETLYHLLTNVLPRLTLTLKAAEAVNQNKLFDQMCLKSAFYDMEDILDELEYIRHQKKLDKQKILGQKRVKKRLKITLDAEAGPSNQDICIEPSLTLTGDLSHRLKDNMVIIEELIVAAQGIIALAKPSRKSRNVTGRDEDLNEITAMLRNENVDLNPSSSDSKCFSLVGIHGMSGSGKTTLAQHVCKYEKVDGYFDLVMWIRVSRNYSMLEAASMDNKSCPDYKSLDVLENELEKKLEGKRFLLALDDIWCDNDDDKQKLVKLLSQLNLGNRGSKILATSRHKDAFSDLGPGVARTAIPIRPLDDQVLLELFMYYALEDANADDPDQMQLKIIGAEIAQKAERINSGNHPVRAHTRTSRARSDPRGLLRPTTNQHLDELVRRCFAYCSIFPKRYHLNRDELVKLWVAEGFIQSTNAQEDMEAIGQGYFHELMATSFVKPGVYYQGSFQECFRIENGSRREVLDDVRHLFVANGAMVTEEIFKLKNLRTLIIDHMELAPANKEFFEKVFEKLQKLRVLTIETSWTLIDEISVFEIPAAIGHLKHLWYLTLVFYEAALYLPKTVDSLYHLQVLMFGYASDVEVSSDINMGNLTNLRHIIGGEITMHIPNIGRLISIQTIETFDVRREHWYELKQLRDLNKLRGSLTIQNLENVESKKEAHEAKLAAKKGLTELRLFWVNDRACTPGVQAEVLEGLCPPKDLKSLEVWRYQSLRYPSWTLGEQNVDLRPAPELFEHFIHLRHLLIAECCWHHLPDNVKNLRFLKSLMIRLCWYLESLPEHPRSLQKFKVSYCNGVFMSSCKQIGQLNWRKSEGIYTLIMKLLSSTMFNNTFYFLNVHAENTDSS